MPIPTTSDFSDFSASLRLCVPALNSPLFSTASISDTLHLPAEAGLKGVLEMTNTPSRDRSSSLDRDEIEAAA